MATESKLSNELELNADTDGPITTVTLFPYQANVTRTFSCHLACGLTRVKISSGFPISFDESRLRVDVPEGVTLGEVKTVWGKSGTDPLSNDEKIDAFYERKSLLQKSLTRCKRIASALESYAQAALEERSGMSPLDVGRFVDLYEEAGTKWDVKVASLEKEIRELEDEIDVAETSDGSSNPSEAPKCSRASVTFTMSTETEKNVDLNVTYGVNNTYWYPGYDLYARSDNDETVTMIYKAFISNSSGESWNDVVLKVESVAPQTTARLRPWKLSFQKPQNDNLDAVSSYPPPKVLTRAQMLLSEKVTLLDKTHGHCFVLGHYILTAQLSRLCTPRVSCNIFLRAKVTNNSSYPLLSGSSGIYLDGNFMSNVYLSSVNPGEMFDVFLGTDPDIRITYHPCLKDNSAIDSPSPFVLKPVSAYSCTQRITIANLRNIPVSSLTIIDNIPTAEDIDIVVKLVNPPLKYPESTASGFKDGGSARAGVQVTEGIPETCNVVARWDMVDEPPQDLSLLGVNGKINWVCSVGKKESMDINSQWQVLVYSTKQLKDF